MGILIRSNAKDVAIRLTVLKQGMLKREEPHRQTGWDNFRQVRANILSGQQWDGSPMKPLAPSTVKKKGHARLLIDKGRMLRSIRFKVRETRKGRVWTTSIHPMGRGSAFEHMKYTVHTEGRPFPDSFRHVPQRDFAAFNPRQVGDNDRIFLRFMDRLIERF